MRTAWDPQRRQNAPHHPGGWRLPAMSQMTSVQQSPRQARKNLPPGPRGTFFWGMLGEMRRDMLGLYRSAHQQYGDVITLPFAGVDTFSVSHPDHFK